MNIETTPRTTIAISGFSSEVGKTTLMSDLLRAFPEWEAIKMTRGHYRSCGKDPHVCCVSHLLSDEPVIRSGRAQTYAAGKDTGRYWDAGASNVHWVIVTDAQVEKGINLALDRVFAPGVLIEGTSFLKYVAVDFSIMVVRAGSEKIKPSAKRALATIDAFYLFTDKREPDSSVTAAARNQFAAWGQRYSDGEAINKLPLYTYYELPQLIAQIRSIHAAASTAASVSL